MRDDKELRMAHDRSLPPLPGTQHRIKAEPGGLDRAWVQSRARRPLSNKGHTGWGSKIKGGRTYEYVHEYLIYLAWPSLASKTDKRCQINREDTPGDHINT